MTDVRRTLPAPFRAVAIVAGAVVIWLVVDLGVETALGTDYLIATHIARAVAVALLVALLFIGMLRGERATLADYGLRPRRRSVVLAGIGALAYAVPFAIAAAVILALSLARFELYGGPGALGAQALAVLALVLVYEAIPEELIFRGYLFSVLSERMPAWATVIVQAAAFCLFAFLIGAMHGWEGLVLFSLMGLSIGTIRALTGSVFATIGFHATFQLVTQLINGPQWPAIALIDPELWMRDVAFFAAPVLLGPVIVAVVMRRRSSRGVAPA